MFLAHSRTPDAVKRVRWVNWTERAFSSVLSVVISCGAVCIATYIVFANSASTLSSEELEVFDYLMLGMTTLTVTLVLVTVVALLARAAIADDIKKRIVLEADSVVRKIRSEALAGEHSDDSLFELQRARNAATREWRAEYCMY